MLHCVAACEKCGLGFEVKTVEPLMNNLAGFTIINNEDGTREGFRVVFGFWDWKAKAIRHFCGSCLIQAIIGLPAPSDPSPKNDVPVVPVIPLPTPNVT